MKIEKSYPKKKRIIFFSDDPAGGVIVEKILNEISNDHIVFPFFSGPSEKYINRNKFNNHNLEANISKKKLKKLILEKKPDLMITAAGTYNMNEHNARIIAKSCKIKTISIIDYWCEYSSRFRRIVNNKTQYSYPDWIFIMDKKSKRDFLKETKFPNDRIFVSGSINLESIFDNFVIRDKNNYTKKISKNLTLTFFSDAFYTKKNKGFIQGNGTCFDDYGNSLFGYTPDKILDIFIQTLIKVNLNLKKKIKLVIKPHPREVVDSLVPIAQRYTKVDKNIKFHIELNKNSENLIFDSDLIFGMGSVALFEAGIASKPTFSIQIGIDRAKIYDPCIANYFNYSIQVDTKLKLKKILLEYLNNPLSTKFSLNKKSVNFNNALFKTINKINEIS